MNCEELLEQLPSQFSIEKPKAGVSDCEVVINNEGKRAVRYHIGKTGSRKTISFCRLITAMNHLDAKGEFTRESWEKWDSKAVSQPCDFTTIGGLFVYLGIATRSANGKYSKVAAT